MARATPSFDLCELTLTPLLSVCVDEASSAVGAASGSSSASGVGDSILAAFWDSPPTNFTISGDLQSVSEASGASSFARSIVGRSSGMYYFELGVTFNVDNDCDCSLGIADGLATSLVNIIGTGRWTRGIGFQNGGGDTAPTDFITGARLGFQVNFNTLNITTYLNNVQVTSISFSAGTWYVCVGTDNDPATHSFTIYNSSATFLYPERASGGYAAGW